MDESASSNKVKTFKVNGNFTRGHPSKTWNEAIRSDLKQMKVIKGLSKDRNA